jgi:hypothetical protein
VLDQAHALADKSPRDVRCGISAAVVDNHDFEVVARLAKNGSHGGRQGPLAVIGRYNDREPGRWGHAVRS